MSAKGFVFVYWPLTKRCGI